MIEVDNPTKCYGREPRAGWDVFARAYIAAMHTTLAVSAAVLLVGAAACLLRHSPDAGRRDGIPVPLSARAAQGLASATPEPAPVT